MSGRVLKSWGQFRRFSEDLQQNAGWNLQQIQTEDHT